MEQEIALMNRRKPASHRWWLPLATTLVLLPRAVWSDGAPTFGLEFQGPSVLRVADHETGRARGEYEVVLTSIIDIPSGDGPKAWSFGIAASGLRILAIELDGTAAADSREDPVGVFLDGEERSELAIGPDGLIAGVVSSVVLSLSENRSLPPNRPAVVARIVVEGMLPSGNDATTGRLDFVDTLRPASDPTASPIPNEVRFFGIDFAPSVTPLDVRVTSSDGETAAAFRRGDANGDGRADLSDALGIVQVLFLGDPSFDCEEAADVDDDGEVQLTDAIGLARFLFLGGPPPPAPGPFECGTAPNVRAEDCVTSGCA